MNQAMAKLMYRFMLEGEVGHTHEREEADGSVLWTLARLSTHRRRERRVTCPCYFDGEILATLPIPEQTCLRAAASPATAAIQYDDVPHLCVPASCVSPGVRVWSCVR